MVWADAEELLEAVLAEREMVGNVTIKVMADGGQGFFKICFSTIPENYSDESDSNNEMGNQEEEEYLNPKKKRKLYSGGGSVGKKAKLTILP